MRHGLIRFARRTGQPLPVVLQMHPRDMATWDLLDLRDQAKREQDARFAELHQEGG